MAHQCQWLDRRGDTVQRFGSALNLNVRFHMLFRDGTRLADVAVPPVKI